ncbi:MAG TPA: sel1 repeat family protein [Legionellaceae bacterium]|nr:sel1 repeat family protein [Legionellaceae bacterium]
MRGFLIGLIISVLMGCTSSYNLQEGIKSFQVQDFRQAFIRLRPEAEKGSAEAQYAIGYMYYYGQGVIEDRRKAWYWITLAAKNGNTDAQNAMKILQKSAGKVDEVRP